MAETFTLSLANFAKAAPEKAETVVRRASQDVLAKVVWRSPGDTGRLRNNWNTHSGAAYTSTTETTDKSGQEAIARGTAILAAPVGERSIFITNSLPYAIPLEYGHSKKQAPAGMVRITVSEWQTYIDDAAKAAQATP